VSFDELPPYIVRSFTYCNEQVRADEVERVMVCNIYIHTHTNNKFCLNSLCKVGNPNMNASGISTGM
jgi:hypothetical protein